MRGVRRTGRWPAPSGAGHRVWLVERPHAGHERQGDGHGSGRIRLGRSRRRRRCGRAALVDKVPDLGELVGARAPPAPTARARRQRSRRRCRGPTKTTLSTICANARCCAERSRRPWASTSKQRAVPGEPAQEAALLSRRFGGAPEELLLHAHSSGGQIIRRRSGPGATTLPSGRKRRSWAGIATRPLSSMRCRYVPQNVGPGVAPRPALARASPLSPRFPHYSPFFSTGGPNPNRCVVRRQRKQMYASPPA